MYNISAMKYYFDLSNKRSKSIQELNNNKKKIYNKYILTDSINVNFFLNIRVNVQGHKNLHRIV